MAFLLAHLEIILSAVGILVIVFVPSLVNPNPDTFWEVTAITAILVGLIHGMIFWLIRRRQRTIRTEIIHELRTILTDVINNQLVALSLHARKLSSMSDPASEIDAHLRVLDQSAQAISTYVNLLSEESIREWKERYERPLR
jgi:LytS/YehU family sensor histidine kinase